MKRLSVESIIIPLEGDVPKESTVGPRDRITDALEVLLKNDLKRIAVMDGEKVLGMIRLEDALRQVGLDGSRVPKGTPSLVVHGRKIVLKP